VAKSLQWWRHQWVKSFALEVFGSEVAASDWLHTRTVTTYRYQSPFSMAGATDQGFFMVAEHLTAIEDVRNAGVENPKLLVSAWSDLNWAKKIHAVAVAK